MWLSGYRNAGDAVKAAHVGSTPGRHRMKGCILPSIIYIYIYIYIYIIYIYIYIYNYIVCYIYNYGQFGKLWEILEEKTHTKTEEGSRGESGNFMLIFFDFVSFIYICIDIKLYKGMPTFCKINLVHYLYEHLQ